MSFAPARPHCPEWLAPAMKLTEDDRTDLREIRNMVVSALIVSTCGAVVAGIAYLVTVLPPSIKALQEDVAPLPARITGLERELNDLRTDHERLKAIIKLKHP